MDRRTFLRALAALPLVGSVPALAKYRGAGPVDVASIMRWEPSDIINIERWGREHRGKRCLLDGVDVTNNAVMCLPGENGWVVGLVRDPKTGRVLKEGAPGEGWRWKYETRYGRVEIRPGKPVVVVRDNPISVLRQIDLKLDKLDQLNQLIQE